MLGLRRSSSHPTVSFSAEVNRGNNSTTRPSHPAGDSHDDQSAPCTASLPATVGPVAGPGFDLGAGATLGVRALADTEDGQSLDSLMFGSSEDTGQQTGIKPPPAADAALNPPATATTAAGT
jgi:hypothetical protein